MVPDDEYPKEQKALQEKYADEFVDFDDWNKHEFVYRNDKIVVTCWDYDYRDEFTRKMQVKDFGSDSETFKITEIRKRMKIIRVVLSDTKDYNAISLEAFNIAVDAGKEEIVTPLTSAISVFYLTHGYDDIIIQRHNEYISVGKLMDEDRFRPVQNIEKMFLNGVFDDCWAPIPKGGNSEQA